MDFLKVENSTEENKPSQLGWLTGLHVNVPIGGCFPNFRCGFRLSLVSFSPDQTHPPLF